ncbi:MAG: beta strand repeat-containing protein, partial [Halothiobacillus sp.]
QNASVSGGVGGDGAFAGQGGAGVVVSGNTSVVIKGSVSGGLAGSGSGTGSRADAVTLSGGGNLLSINNSAHITGNLHSYSGSTNGGDSLALGGGGGSISASQLIGFQNYSVTGGGWTLTGVGDSSQNWTLSGGATGLIGTTDSLVGNINAGGGSFVNFLNNPGGTYGGIISGAGDVAISGGTLAFSGANSYSGATVLNGASLALTGNGTLGNNTYVSMNGSSVLDFSASTLGQRSGTQNLDDLVGGVDSVVHLGGARLNITGAGGGIFYGSLDSTGAALVSVTGGQWGLAGSVTTGLPFQIGSRAQVNVYGNGMIANGVNIQSMGLLDIGNTNTGFSTAFLSGAGAVALSDKNLTLTNGGDATFAGRVAGAGGLHLVRGTQIFTNQFGPIYSGNTVIDPGAKLVLGLAGSMPSSAHVINNGILSIAGTAPNTAKIVSLAGNGLVTLDGSSSRALQITNGSDTFAGVISNPIAGSPGNVIVSGGVQKLSGVNTYSGQTTIMADSTQGTLALIGRGSIANSSQVILSGGGIFDISGTSQGATVQQVASNLPGAGGVNLGDQTLTISNPTAAAFSFGGQFIGQQGGVHLQNGQMKLSYASAYQGNTAIDSGATIALTGQGMLPNSTVVVGGTLDGSSTNLTNAAGNFVQVGGLAGSGSVKLGFNTLQINNAQNTVFDGTIEQTKNASGANGLLVMQGGTQTFNNQVNLVSGMVVQQGATLKFGQQGSLFTPSNFTNMGLLDFSASTAQQLAGNMLGTGSLVLGKGGLKLTDANTDYGGVISGTGGLEFAQGQNFLGGANTYSGATQIDAGASLLMLLSGSLANSEVQNAGVFDLSQLGATSTTIGGISGAGLLNLSNK